MTERVERTTGSRGAVVEFDKVTKRYAGGKGDPAAVQELSIRIPGGEICALVGPSGCGKTTTLKMVNRLIPLTEGDISIDGRSVRAMDIIELRRQIGYVIQHVGLFPHMRVKDNIATVPRLLRWPDPEVDRRVHELLELLGLAQEHAQRYPAQLSGGQRQRVGLARAMAADPPLMLMDEPFGAIDPITRERLQDDFLRLHRTIRKTVIFVTHGLAEAITLSDRVIVMTRRSGRIKLIHKVKLPRPRDVIRIRETDAYAREFSTLWHVLGEEFAKATEIG